jgi:hypothetical protein
MSTGAARSLPISDRMDTNLADESVPFSSNEQGTQTRMFTGKHGEDSDYRFVFLFGQPKADETPPSEPMVVRI